METTNQSMRVSSDRLSSLPDSVLCHILSFVPTKDSVATSILARRWKSLWADVPVLDFDIEYRYANAGVQTRFLEIINKVMPLHNVLRLNTFRLWWKEVSWKEDHTEDQDQLDEWISTAIARNVQALDLDISHEVKLPHCIFTCITLVDLRLHGRLGILDDVCLPNLKKLHLHSVDAGETLLSLISGCPVLEELIMQDIGVLCCNISSPTIKWLALDIQIDSGVTGVVGRKLDINTPALRYLLVEDHFSEDISAGALDSLVEADIWLNNDRVKDDAQYSRSVLEFVDKLCQVKCLKFSTGYPKFLDSSFAAAATRFDNLTKLELGADWRFLMKFLEAADNLEVLVIREVDEDLKGWVEPEQVPVCLSSHLRQVTIDPFGFSEDEFKMVSYILKNAKVMNMMEIYAQYLGSDSDVEFNELQRISLFERGCGTCNLAFF